MIDKMVLENCKRRLTNLRLALKDYKKAYDMEYDMVPQSWILECMKIFKVSKNIIESPLCTRQE